MFAVCKLIVGESFTSTRFTIPVSAITTVYTPDRKCKKVNSTYMVAAWHTTEVFGTTSAVYEVLMVVWLS